MLHHHHHYQYRPASPTTRRSEHATLPAPRYDLAKGRSRVFRVMGEVPLVVSLPKHGLGCLGATGAVLCSAKKRTSSPFLKSRCLPDCLPAVKWHRPRSHARRLRVSSFPETNFSNKFMGHRDRGDGVKMRGCQWRIGDPWYPSGPSSAIVTSCNRAKQLSRHAAVQRAIGAIECLASVSFVCSRPWNVWQECST